MLNLIKMDLYRMIKGKSTWIILGIVGIMMFVFVYITAFEREYFMNNPSVLDMAQAYDTGISFGYNTSISNSWLFSDKQIPLAALWGNNLQSRTLTLFLVIFGVIFVNGESKTGFIKNIAGQLSYRGKLIVAKLVSISLFSILLFLIVGISMTLGSQIFLGYVNIGDLGEALPFIMKWL